MNETMKPQKLSQENRAYQEMLKPAVARLQGRNPQDIEKKGNVIFRPENSLLEIPSMGETYEISYPDFKCRGNIDEWLHLVMLHYLDLGDGTPVSWDFITFGNMKDGLIRGTGFDRTVDRELQQIFRGKENKEIREICESLGEKFQGSTKGDMCVVLPFLPRVPMILMVWFADEEFEATGKLLLTASVDHYLTIEDAVTAGEYVLRYIKKKFQEEQ